MNKTHKPDAPRKRDELEPLHDNLTDTDQTDETLDQRAMDAADEAGSALLQHDKVTRKLKDRA